MCFKNLWKIQFFRKRKIPKVCTFGPTLTSLPTPFLPEHGQNRKKKNYLLKKSFAVGLSKNGKINLLLPFRKNTITFCPIFGRKPAKIKDQRVRSKLWNRLFHHHGSWPSSNKKNFCSSTFSFCSYKCQRSFL